MTEPVIEACSSGVSKCPAGLIGIRLRRSHVDGAVDLRRDLVHDSVLVFAEALRSFRKDANIIGQLIQSSSELLRVGDSNVSTR